MFYFAKKFSFEKSLGFHILSLLLTEIELGF